MTRRNDMSFVPSLEEAKEMLKKYNEDEFHLKHGEIVSGVMGYFAKEFDPGREDYWKVVGLLHDLDFELYPEEHCVKQQELMKDLDLDPGIIYSTCSHGWGCTGVEMEPKETMEKVLFATDELTGLIGAAALMRPSRSVNDMEAKSVKKKFKDKRFAAGCSRDIIAQGAEMLSWDIDQLIERTLEAMKSLNPELEI